ncbi:predicted protein [Arabidopsis lyrata subsp. lyrata]|uniref:Predicted protein n=1 Tax=Arabidopsis lyrata subsp. lyrata TaxID=81972 RepID=D7KHJ3_ARALL|nr:predicted protein [Arabidopsis lyrata subsp. lyrata]
MKLFPSPSPPLPVAKRPRSFFTRLFFNNLRISDDVSRFFYPIEFVLDCFTK